MQTARSCWRLARRSSHTSTTRSSDKTGSVSSTVNLTRFATFSRNTRSRFLPATPSRKSPTYHIIICRRGENWPQLLTVKVLIGGKISGVLRGAIGSWWARRPKSWWSTKTTTSTESSGLTPAWGTTKYVAIVCHWRREWNKSFLFPSRSS